MLQNLASVQFQDLSIMQQTTLFCPLFQFFLVVKMQFRIKGTDFSNRFCIKKTEPVFQCALLEHPQKWLVFQKCVQTAIVYTTAQSFKTHSLWIDEYFVYLCTLVYCSKCKRTCRDKNAFWNNAQLSHVKQCVVVLAKNKALLLNVSKECVLKEVQLLQRRKLPIHSEIQRELKALRTNKRDLRENLTEVKSTKNTFKALKYYSNVFHLFLARNPQCMHACM